LEILGFPWILSSESRLINGLRGIFGGNFFVRPFLARQAGRTLKVEGIRKGGIVHEVSLLQFLIASNQLSRRATSGPAEFPLLILTHAVGLFFKGGPRIVSGAPPLPVR
jgi:hypothetical protein